MILIALETHDHFTHLQSFIDHLDELKSMGIGIIGIESSFDITPDSLELMQQSSRKMGQDHLALLQKKGLKFSELLCNPTKVISHLKKLGVSTTRILAITQYLHFNYFTQLISATVEKGFHIYGIDINQQDTDSNTLREKGMADSLHRLTCNHPNTPIFVILGAAHGLSVAPRLKQQYHYDNTYLVYTYSYNTLISQLNLTEQLINWGLSSIKKFNFSTVQGEALFYHTLNKQLHPHSNNRPQWSFFATLKHPYGPYSDCLCSHSSIADTMALMETESPQQSIAHMISRIPDILITPNFVTFITMTRRRPKEIAALTLNPVGKDSLKKNRLRQIINTTSQLKAN